MKVISLFPNKIKNFKVTQSVLRIAFSFSLLMITLHLLFNIILIGFFNYYLNLESDVRLKHELARYLNSFKYSYGHLEIVNKDELEEKSLQKVSEDAFYLEVFNPEGKLIYQSNNAKIWGAVPLIKLPPGKDIIIEDVKFKQSKLRVAVAKIINSDNQNVYLQLWLINSSLTKAINKILAINLITFPFVIFLVFVLSIIIANKTFEPINRVIKLAKNISATNIKARLDYPADPEDALGRLKTAFNNLLDRLEKQITEISQFSNNASHQLMTPLTSIQTELEFILRKERTNEEYRNTLLEIKSETSRMIKIVRAMLLLAKADDLSKELINIFNLSALFKKEIIPAYSNNPNVKFDIKKGIYLKGREDFISIVLYNLIDNAVKYSNDKDDILVRAFLDNDSVVIEVEDFGIGITEEEMKNIFERFYRGKDAEIKGIKGFGLGLSLVKTIVEGFKGEIEIDNKREKGVKFTLKFKRIRMD